MTLQDRIAAIDEGALDVHRSYRSVIDELVMQNQALKQENRILEARLQEARRGHEPSIQLQPPPRDGMIPAPEHPQKRYYAKCQCGREFWARGSKARLCGVCYSLTF